MNRFMLAAITAALVAALILVLSRSPLHTITGSVYYEQMASPIATYDIFDIGVADINGDRFLDLFTSNHSARQDIQINYGSTDFDDALSSAALDQDRQFPQLEDALREPTIDQSGLYIYRLNRWLHFRAHGIDRSRPIEGSIEIPWPITVRESPDSVQVLEQESASGLGATVVRFRLKESEALVFKGVEDIVEVPHRVQLRGGADLTRVFVGLEKSNPKAPEFDLHWRDRHGMAWADYDGDSYIDLFIGRGGVKGRLNRASVPVADELFVGAGSLFIDRTEASGLTKGNCPSRQVAWVDFDMDGDLDLHVSCGRGDEPEFPDQLFRQGPEHTFFEVASELGLDYRSATVFSWFDTDRDGDIDLLSLQGDRIYHYVNLGGHFDKRAVGSNLEGARPYKFAVADFDNDGDFDAYAVHGKSSYLLRSNGSDFEVLPPSSVGLPASARTANWVDSDNDGLQDLYVIPGGLYSQGSDHTFLQSKVLQATGHGTAVVDARSSWFDMDNDGYRDFVAAFQSGPDLWQRAMRKLAKREPDLRDRWQTVIFRYSGPVENHWLQIQLVGYRQNRQAIGARASVFTRSGSQMQHVGGAEGSHFSQGHYRLYFGLGDETSVEKLIVTWPNGASQLLQDVKADQLLVINYAVEDLIAQ